MKILKRLWNHRRLIRAFIPSLIFNLRHLPFSQAIKLPILIYKPDLRNNCGQFEIVGPIKFGMIRLGFDQVSIYPNNGITLENYGKIIFKGKTSIGNNSALSVGRTGTLEFGDNFTATTGLKLACYASISFGKNVLIGWNTQFMDTDFHLLKYVNGGG